MSEPGAAARAYAWLAQAVEPEIWADWSRPLLAVLGEGPEIIWTEPWPHDYWVAQGSRHALGVGTNVVQVWTPGRALDDWPFLETDLTMPGQVTNSAGLDSVLAEADPLPYDHDPQLARFLELPMELAEVVRAWMDSALGSALAGLAYAATDDPGMLGEEVRRRLDRVWELTAEGQAVRIDLTRAVEALYTARWDNLEPVLVPTHQGMPISAADHWYWLGQTLDAADLRDAFAVAAGLLVSPPLLAALVDVVRSEALAPLALCVLRRWALGLRAMAWAEVALSHQWRDVRQVDVVMFAYAAVAPWWPRPSVAISHRSGEVKPELIRLNLWGSAHVAIDAVTIPSLESNTGLVWRLFAATPTVVRVRSAGYQASEWCRRESELSQYLVEHADFFRGRVVADADVAELPAVQGARPDFPPVTLVLDVPSWPPLIVDLLAAVGTLRLLHGLIQDVDIVNEIAGHLAAGRLFDMPPPTNDPDGWAVHYEVFRALAEHSGDEVPVLLAPDYPEQQLVADLDDYVMRIPDLTAIAGGVDVFAALEWNREIRRWFGERWGSDRVVVDFRGLDEEDWVTNAGHGIKRGMLRVRTDTLVFVVQNANQQVDRWPVVGDRDIPILTQHVDGQLRWLAQAMTLPTWIAAYTSLPEFDFAAGVVDAAFESLRPEFEAHTGLAAPTQYSDVFAVGPESAILEMLPDD